MPLTRLIRANGFSQRHVGEVRCSKYLKSLEGEQEYWRSPVSLPLIRKDVLQFDNPSVRPRDVLLDRAIAHARRAFNIGVIPILHLNDVFQSDLQIWKRSPGLPWKSVGYRTKDEVRRDPRAVQQIRWFWHRIKSGEAIGAPDCCAFVRSHLTETGDHKVRAVWGYPMTMTMGEAVFAVPLIRAYQSRSSPIAYGYETAIGGCRKLLSEMGTDSHFAALDFSSFDKSVPAWLIEVAFDVLSYNLDFVRYQDRGIADARRISTMFDYIKRYFIHTPIRLSDGSRYRKHSGVASGSYFTQLVDSVCNYILITWAYLRQHGQYPNHIKVMGDDSIIGSDLPIDLDLLALHMSEIGMKINVQKSSVSKFLHNLTFLGYTINDGTPSKPYQRWLAALLYPEYPDRSWDIVASRALGLCYACMGVDDKFDSLCRTIVGLRPFDLAIGSNLMRMLEMIGVKEVKKEPPDKLEFLRRMRLV